MQVYFNGAIINKDDVKISPDDRGFLFGDGVYEVLMGYSGKLFRVEDHLARLKWNLSEIKIQGADDIHYADICTDLIRLNRLSDKEVKAYIQVTRGVAPRRHAFPEGDIKPTVYIEVNEFFPPVDKWETGVKIILLPDERRERCDIKSISLLPSILGTQHAAEHGAEESVFYRDEFITEGSHTTFCIIKDGEVITSPMDHHILPGITRKVICELCKNLDIPFIEKHIEVEKLHEADEMFILGSSTEVMPVVKVENWKVNSGKPGPVTRKLQSAFRKMVLEN